jgi:hypothetical protein
MLLTPPREAQAIRGLLSAASVAESDRVTTTLDAIVTLSPAARRAAIGSGSRRPPAAEHFNSNTNVSFRMFNEQSSRMVIRLIIRAFFSVSRVCID